MSVHALRVERTLARLTWRLLLGRRRWIWLLVCNALPPALAWLFVIDQHEGPPDLPLTFTGVLVASLVLTGLLPLAGLTYGGTALGQEIEDGTLGYLLATPTARWRLVATKTLVAAAATVLTVLPGTVAAVWIVLGSPVHPLALGFAVGIAAASVLYAALFLALSLVTRRALVIGLLYIIGWEGALSRSFAGTRVFSVREYATTLAQRVAAMPLPQPFASPLEPATAVWMGSALLAIAFALAVARLRSVELLEEV